MKHATVTALTLFVFSVATASAQKEGVNWKDYLGGPEGSHYSPLKQINAANVSRMEAAWTYPPGDGNSVFCPLVVDNIAYISAKGGALVALDATTGKELWVTRSARAPAAEAESAASAAEITGKAKTARTAAYSLPRAGISTPSMR